jgi:predicted MFS family arabinose efflux permease
VTWRALLRVRAFRRLWFGDAVSLLGDWFTYVAVGTLAVAEGSLWAVAMVLLAHTLPRAVLSPIAGRLADRHDRRTIVIGFSLLRAVVVVGMIAAVDAGATGVVQALLFVRMGLGAFVDPAAGAALPQVVPAEAVGPANALLGATWSVMFAVGVGLGGLATAEIGTIGALAIDGVTFLIAAAIFAGLPRLPPGTGAPHDRGRLADAWALAWRDRPVLQAALAKLPLGFASGGAWIWLHAVAGQQRLGDAALALGTLHAVRGVGTGLGPLLWTRIHVWNGTVAGMHVATWLGFAAIAGFVVSPTPVVALIVVTLWGMGVGANWVAATTRLQTLTPNHALGRIGGIHLMITTAGQCLGGVLGALAAEAFVAGEAAGWAGLLGGAGLWLTIEALVRWRRPAAPAYPA